MLLAGSSETGEELNGADAEPPSPARARGLELVPGGDPAGCGARWMAGLCLVLLESPPLSPGGNPALQGLRAHLEPSLFHVSFGRGKASSASSAHGGALHASEWSGAALSLSSSQPGALRPQSRVTAPVRRLQTPRQPRAHHSQLQTLLQSGEGAAQKPAWLRARLPARSSHPRRKRPHSDAANLQSRAS